VRTSISSTAMRRNRLRSALVLGAGPVRHRAAGRLPAGIDGHLPARLRIGEQEEAGVGDGLLGRVDHADGDHVVAVGDELEGAGEGVEGGPSEAIPSSSPSVVPARGHLEVAEQEEDGAVGSMRPA
jgi:hypothetical protein